MNDNRDDLEEPDGPELSTYIVEANGCFGSATWVVCKQLYDLLPRGKRDTLLAMTGDRKIGPFFTRTAAQLLRQADCPTDVNALDPTWSFESAEVTCAFGQVTWQIGDGLWDELPEDQRETLIEAAKALIHGYFHEEIQGPLTSYAFRKLQH